MAAARLKRTVEPHPQPLARDVKLLTTVEGVPALERARELFLCGLRPEALSEWRLGFENLPEGGRQQAIHLAAQWGWYDQAIAVASRQSVFYDYELLYPRPYDKEGRRGRPEREAAAGPRVRHRASGEPVSRATRCRAPMRAASCS